MLYLNNFISKIKKAPSYMKSLFFQRKYYFIFAVLLFIAELVFLIGPNGWLRESIDNYLTGENSWAIESKIDTPYIQEFSPEYSQLKSIGIVLTTAGGQLGEGNIILTILDKNNNILFQASNSYADFALEGFQNIDVGLKLQTKKRYFLSIGFQTPDSGTIPSLKACSSDYYLPENISLRYGEPIEKAQLVTRYIYENALPYNKFLKVLLLCFATFLVIAFGLPKSKKIRLTVGLLLLAAGPFILGRRLELLTFDTGFRLPFSMTWVMTIMYLSELILFLCSQSLRFSICMSNLLWTLLYSANYYVWTFRGEPLRFGDFQSIGTALSVLNGYSLKTNTHVAMCWCIFLLFFIIGLHVGLSKKGDIINNAGKKKYLLQRLKKFVFGFSSGIIIFTISLYLLLYTDLLSQNGFLDYTGWGRNEKYHYNGYLIATLIDLQTNIKSFKAIKPELYSRKEAQALLDSYSSGQKDASAETLPHVILILNESFSDLRVLGNLELSEENLPFFYGLKENTIKGYVNVSVLGGKTANSEFEVLTGCSMGLLPPDYIPYQQCINRPLPSLVSNMEDLGYASYSIHPESKSNWHRGFVYDYLGFDHSLWIEDFEGAETIHHGVSDLETYKRVEEIFENRSAGERLFIFDLTKQNHGGYTEEDEDRPITALNTSSTEADLFLSLISYSDQAFKQLVTYFEQQEEPIIICMFGDHQPNITQSSFYTDIFSQTEGITQQDQILNKYKTPFIIWANYDIPEMDGLDISINYLSPLLLKIAGIPCSPYFSFLQQYMEKYPIITVNTYQDSNGNYHDWTNDDSELTEYKILQYYYLFDS